MANIHRTLNIFDMDLINLIKLISEILTATGVVIGACQYFRDTRRNAKKNTLDAYKSLQDSTLSKINMWLPAEIKEATLDKTSDAYKELSTYLANIELFCVGLNEGIYDFDTFYKIAHGYFESDQGLLKPRLLPLLEAKLENATTDYYENLHKIWRRMYKRS